IRDFHVTGVQTCALPILLLESYLEDAVASPVLTWARALSASVARSSHPHPQPAPRHCSVPSPQRQLRRLQQQPLPRPPGTFRARSEEHTSELQSRENLVC